MFLLPLQLIPPDCSISSEGVKYSKYSTCHKKHTKSILLSFKHSNKMLFGASWLEIPIDCDVD